MTLPKDRPAPGLDASALAAAPVWRFLAAGESSDPAADESYVRAQESPPALGEQASYLIAATYTLVNGRQLPGLVQVDVLGRNVEFEPCAIYASGKEVDPSSREAEKRLGRILHEENARPTRWELAVTLAGEDQPRRGAISSSAAVRALGLLVRLARLRGLR